MKKSMLKKLKVLTLSNNQIRKINRANIQSEEEQINTRTKRSTWTYRYHTAIIAAVEQEILKVAIFERKDIEDESKEPRFTLFIDKKKGDWISYSHLENKWYTATIYNLLYRVAVYSNAYGDYTYIEKSDQKTINEYLETDMSAKKAIFEWQRVAGLKKNTQRMTEMQSIDEFMETVPELPKDFEKWVWSTAYRNNATYILMKAGNVKEGYCTHCRKMVELPKIKPKHNDKGICKECGTRVTYKGWNKQNNLYKHLNLSIIQKTTAGPEYVVRIFESYQEYKDRLWTEEPKKDLHEIYRFRINKFFDAVEVFEYGEYRRTGIIRWCHEIPKGMGYWYSPSTVGIPYTRNISRILTRQDVQEAKYVPLANLIQNLEDQGIEIDDAINKAVKWPGMMEKLIKTKMYKLCEEILDRNNAPEEINPEGRNLKEILKLPKEYVDDAIKTNAGYKEIRVMQAAAITKTWITSEQTRKLLKFYPYATRDDHVIFLQKGNLVKTLNYLEKLEKENDIQAEYAGRDYKDYLEQLERLGVKPTKKNKYPQDFYSTHAELAELVAEKENKERKKENRRLNRELKKRITTLKEMYKLDSEEYEIVWPNTKKDFVVEGQLQHNCVGGYFKQVAEGETVVFFLREKSNLKKPFCTVEFREGICWQCRTKYNKEAPAEAMKAMKQITENYKKIKKVTKKAEISKNMIAAAV